MVVWAGPAKADLQAIHDFIARDSRYYAKKVVQDIYERMEGLNEFPEIRNLKGEDVLRGTS